MSYPRQQLLVAFLAPLYLLVSCGGEARESSKDHPSVATAVNVETVRVAPVANTYEAVGTVRSRVSSILSSKVMGQVLSVKAQQGDYVKAGQVLVEIDGREGAANLSKAQAGHAEARNALQEAEESIRAAESARASADAAAGLATSTYKRYQTLLERKSVSQQEFDEVEFKYKAAEAEARRAEQMALSIQARKNQVLARIEQANADIRVAEAYMSYARVTAPFAGLVTARHVEAGTLSSPGVPLLTVEDSQNYQLEASVEESQIGRIRIGQKTEAIIDALGSREIPAAVAEIVPGGDPSSRSFLVKLRLPRIEGLRSGMFGRARFAAGAAELLTIPSAAVFHRGQLTGVYVVDETGKARLRLVKTGKSYGERVEVLSGLAPGERVVANEPGRLEDGALVKQR